MNEDFDDVLRSRLHQAEPNPSFEAHRVFSQLEPVMLRARIRRGVAIGTATLSLLGVSGVGLAAVASSLREPTPDLDILVDRDTLPETTAQTPTTAPNAIETADDSSREETHTSASSLPATTADTDVTTTVVPTAPAPTVTSASPSVSTSRANPPPAGTAAAPEPQASTIPSTPTTAMPTTRGVTTATTDTATTTTPLAPATQRTIQSNCGSITVAHDSDSVTLMSTQPNSGFSSDIKESGPDEVKVRFESGGARCEITAWIESGELRIDVENDDGDDDGD